MARKKTNGKAQKQNNASPSKKAKVLSNEQKLEKLRQKLRFIFETADFTYVESDHHTMYVGLRDIELDMMFVYENIMVICEDTADSDKIGHAMKKQEAFLQIENYKKEFFGCLCSEFNKQKELFERYRVDEYKIIYLYFTPEDLGFDDDQKERFNLIRFINPESVEYLYQMTTCIQKSVKYEFFRFLQITDADIGDPSTSDERQKRVKAAIISPEGATGLENGARIVSFMMKAEDLIKNCYVMRKDNWEQSAFLYQRLIKKERINSIRDYLINNKSAFFNNIIVSLPDDIQFFNEKNEPVKLKEISTHGAYTMEIPDRMNSICVIDGQHRIYAHYESMTKDSNELQMERMRKRLHLLVTGIIYPKDMKKSDRTKFESQIFLNINTNAKHVSPEVLIHIESMANPLGANGLARAVLEKMNKNGPFAQKLETSSLVTGKIKTSSMVKFALRNLVDVKSKNKYFYHHWDGNKQLLLDGDEEALDAYVTYCANNLSMYFNAVRNVFNDAWVDDNSKLLSVISINGFIIAFGYCMDQYGIKDFQFYKNALSNMALVDFSKENFPYTASQYNKFAREKINPCFDSVYTK